MAEENLDDDLDLGAEQEGGSKKKLIIIIAGAVLLLSLIGVGVWLLLGGDDAEEGAEGEQAQVEEEAEEEKLPPIYHSLTPVFVVNLPPGGDARMLQIGVDVMVRDPALLEFIKHNDPMIRHQLLNIFSSQDAAKLRQSSGKEKLQADVLAELQKIVKQQGGPGEIEAVFFTSFVMQ
jgi:flagellar FliL protein